MLQKAKTSYKAENPQDLGNWNNLFGTVYGGIILICHTSVWATVSGTIVEDYRHTALLGLIVANCLLHTFTVYRHLEKKIQEKLQY